MHAKTETQIDIIRYMYTFRERERDLYFRLDANINQK